MSYRYLLAIGLCGIPLSAAHAWVATVPGSGDNGATARGVGFDGSGDVLAGGTIPTAGESFLAGVKLAGADGRVVWRARQTEGGGNDAAVDPWGNLVVVGQGDSNHTWASNDAQAALFDGADGTSLWDSDTPSVGNHWLQTVAVNPVSEAAWF